MKKLKIIFCGCFLIAAMSFTACGNYDSSAGTTGQQDTNATSEQKQETSQHDNGKYASIADYVASDEVQKSIEIFGGMEDLDIKVKADGNKMIYEYSCTTIAKQAGMEEALKSTLESQKNIFINIANALKNKVNIDNPIITVTYLDKNGDLIYSQDFSAN